MLSFKRIRDPYGWLSLYSDHPIVFHGITWPRAIHLYTALQYDEKDWPLVMVVRHHSDLLKEADKEAMKMVCLLKIKQHPSLAFALQQTGSKMLKWGGPTNELGEVWMEIRDDNRS